MKQHHTNVNAKLSHLLAAIAVHHVVGRVPSRANILVLWTVDPALGVVLLRCDDLSDGLQEGNDSGGFGNSWRVWQWREVLPQHVLLHQKIFWLDISKSECYSFISPLREEIRAGKSANGTMSGQTNLCEDKENNASKLVWTILKINGKMYSNANISVQQHPGM